MQKLRRVRGRDRDRGHDEGHLYRRGRWHSCYFYICYLAIKVKEYPQEIIA